MEAAFTTKVNIRSSPAVTNTNDIGDLYAGDKVYGIVTGAWIGFSKVYRANGTVENFAGYAAVQDPNNSVTKYATLKDVPEPTPNPDPDPEPTVKPLTVTIEGEYYQTVTVTVLPK